MGVLKKLAIILGTSAVIRTAVDLRQPKCEPRYGVQDRNIIVTGANSGIGYETTKHLYREGANVIMACRDEVKAKKALEKIEKQCAGHKKNGKLEFIKLDLNHFGSIHEFANEIDRKDLSIFSLVNNAGVFQIDLNLNEYGFEQNFMVNHLGHQLLTDLLLPRVVQGGSKLSPSKIVYVNTTLYVAGEIKDSFFDPLHKLTPEQFGSTNMYLNSKLAQLLYARELARAIDHFDLPVYVNIASPGFVATNFSRHVPGPKWYKMFGLSPILLFLLRTPRQGAQTILQCVMGNNRASNGLLFQKCKTKKYDEIANDVVLIRKVFDLTQKAIGVD